jgi:hypothetical protein
MSSSSNLQLCQDATATQHRGRAQCNSAHSTSFTYRAFDGMLFSGEVTVDIDVQ